MHMYIRFCCPSFHLRSSLFHLPSLHFPLLVAALYPYFPHALSSLSPFLSPTPQLIQQEMHSLKGPLLPPFTPPSLPPFTPPSLPPFTPFSLPLPPLPPFTPLSLPLPLPPSLYPSFPPFTPPSLPPPPTLPPYNLRSNSCLALVSPRMGSNIRSSGLASWFSR